MHVPTKDHIQVLLDAEREKNARLQKAVTELYFAAVWTPDRQCNETRLWTAVRDAAGIPAGVSSQLLHE